MNSTLRISGKLSTRQIGDEKTQIRRHQLPALVLQHILAVKNVGDDRRIGRRPADAVLVELLDQRGLGKAGRRLGEMLARIHRQKVQRIAFLQIGQHAVQILDLIIVILAVGLLARARRALRYKLS